MKISFVIPDLRLGGAERVTVNLANRMAELGYKVDCVVLQDAGDLRDALKPSVRIVNLDVKRIRRTLIPLIRYLKAERPDGMIAAMWPLTVIAVVSRILSGVPFRLIVAEHTTWSRSQLVQRGMTRHIVKSTMKLFLPKADARVTVSYGAADDLAQFSRLDRSTINVIYNPVGPFLPSQPVEMREPFQWWDGSHKRILAVGMLKTIKSYDTLLNAMALLRDRVNARLLILGEGDCRSALEAQVRDLRLEGSVFMPGSVKITAPFYERADLHVLSSTGEGLPTVLIEALAHGTPVVSTDCPSGPHEILAGGRFGRLVPVGNPLALADAIVQSLAATHDPEELRTRSLDFSIDKATEQYERLLFPVGSRGSVDHTGRS